jgi:hypothetical protein
MVKRRRIGFTRLATLVTRILGVIALASGLVFGQEFSAAMSGVVHDANGGLVPGVTVTAKMPLRALKILFFTNSKRSP